MFHFAKPYPTHVVYVSIWSPANVNVRLQSMHAMIQHIFPSHYASSHRSAMAYDFHYDSPLNPPPPPDTLIACIEWKSIGGGPPKRASLIKLKRFLIHTARRNSFCWLKKEANGFFRARSEKNALISSVLQCVSEQKCRYHFDTVALLERHLERPTTTVCEPNLAH